MSKLNYTPDTEEADGVFWMSTIDFLSAFKYIYICRTLKESEGWKNLAVSGEWKGMTSAGFPGKFRNLPQYKLTVHHPCEGFISIRQKGGDATFRGKNFIAWVVQAQDGNRIHKIDKRAIVGKSSLTNLNVVSSEISFDRKYDYPYTFTILCGSKFSGQKGEGEFDLTVYTRDMSMKLEVCE